MKLRVQARNALASLDPSPVFLEVYRGQRLPENLHIFVGCPEEFFVAPDTPNAYTEGRLIPILDDGNTGVITFYDPASGGLVQKDIEAPDEVIATFANWQQYLANLMIQIAEAIDDDERLRRMSELVGFRHFDALMRFFDVIRDESYDESRVREAQFIEEIVP